MAPDIQQHAEVVPTSAKSAEPLSDEEKRRRFAELRARRAVTRLKADPPLGSNKVGYWARKNDTGELSKLEYLGFSIVHDDPKKPTWKASGLQLDGTYQLGDVILLSIDKDTYEMYLEDNVEKGKQLIRAADDQFKDDCEHKFGRYKVPTFDPTELRKR